MDSQYTYINFNEDTQKYMLVDETPLNNIKHKIYVYRKRPPKAIELLSVIFISRLPMGASENN